jgi:hypothetical protein
MSIVVLPKSFVLLTLGCGDVSQQANGNPNVSRIYLGHEGVRWGEWTPQELRLGAGVVYR